MPALHTNLATKSLPNETLTPHIKRLFRNSKKLSFRASPTPYPVLCRLVGRDPWFDTLTTLSEVEGESRKMAEYHIILDPGSPR
jgi:hypothetical protein